MKKNLILIIMLIFILFMTACGVSKDGNQTLYDDFKAIDNLEYIDEVESPDDYITDDIEDLGEIIDGISVETLFYSMTIPNDWVINEEKAFGNTLMQQNVFEKINADGIAEMTVTIKASFSETANSFRKRILSSGKTLEEYADGSLKDININGTNYFLYNYNYLARYEKQQIDVAIGFSHILGIYSEEFAESMPVFKQIAKSFKILAENNDNADEPYPWEGKNYIPVPGTAAVGNMTLTAKWLIPDTRYLPKSSNKIKLAVNGNVLYIMGDETLKWYMVNNENLNFINEIKLSGHSLFSMQSDINSNVYVSDISGLRVYLGGELINHYKEIDTFETYIHPSGDWGIGYFTSPSPENVIRFIFKENDKADIVPFEFENHEEMGNLNSLVINNEHILVNTRNEKIFVYNFDGKLLKTLETSNKDSMYTIEALLEIPNGYLGYDRIIHSLFVWDENGVYLGKIKNNELFGTSGAIIESMVMAEDGSIYLTATDLRPDNSWEEVLVFQLFIN